MIQTVPISLMPRSSREENLDFLHFRIFRFQCPRCLGRYSVIKGLEQLDCILCGARIRIEYDQPGAIKNAI